MPGRHRSHSTEFKRQVVAEYRGGETLHARGRRHDLSRNLIRIWIEKAESGALDEDVAATELMAEDEARIVALARLVGRQAREIEFSPRCRPCCRPRDRCPARGKSARERNRGAAPLARLRVPHGPRISVRVGPPSRGSR
nr:transposase [Tranquillimonas rosea]